MKTLTRAEEQIMHAIWKIEKGVLKDVVRQFPEPKPATSTVGTVIRNLVEKEFIGFERYGKVNLYYPKISKTEYFKTQFYCIIKNYFDNSFRKFASVLALDNKIQTSDLEDIKNIIDTEISRRKQSVS
jgi:predicted transcriptional regulator